MAEDTDHLAEDMLSALRDRANPENVAGMARFGINPTGTLGVSMTDVRGLAREAKRMARRHPSSLHRAAEELWASGVHEARLLATVIDDPRLVTREQAERWVLDVDSWDVCDQLCANLLWLTDFAWDLPAEWMRRPETFVKRAGLVMAARLGLKDKGPAERIVALLPEIESAVLDERNDVMKAASWALRQIGKRDVELNEAAIASAERICARVPARGGTPAEKAARWVASDVLRELRSEAIRTRLGIA